MGGGLLNYISALSAFEKYIHASVHERMEDLCKTHNCSRNNRDKMVGIIDQLPS